MRTLVAFEIIGEPEPQGSTTTYTGKDGKHHTTSANKDLKSWRHDVKVAAANAMKVKGASKIPKDHAVKLILEFSFNRLKGHYGKKGLLPSAPVHKLTKPDLSKLVRAIEDALVDAGVMVDDNQVVRIETGKAWGEVAKAYVQVIDLAEAWDWA